MRITRFVYNLAHNFVKDLGYECDFMNLKKIILTKEKNPEASKYEWLNFDASGFFSSSKIILFNDIKFASCQDLQQNDEPNCKQIE